MKIEAGTTLRRTERAVQDDPSGEGVLLDADAGVALRLNSTGAWIWAQLEQPCRVEELANGLAQHFEIDSGRALDDVVAFAREMARRELLAAS
jgi:Coenzyme PQQ synthesis protein D (PqqD)